MITSFDDKKNELVIRIKLTGKPGMTRHDAKSAERNNVEPGTVKNYKHASSGGFQKIDKEHKGYPLAVAYNIISEIPPKEVKRIMAEENGDD